MQNYDEIAENYDAIFSDDQALQENDEIRKLLELALKGRGNAPILDIGAGTGLFLDLIPKRNHLYMGIEPSSKMIEKFKKKHPFNTVMQMKLEGIVKPPDGIVYICLFGGLNYVEPDFINKNSLQMEKHPFFLMFYKEDYYPVVYVETGIELQHFCVTEYDLPAHKVIDFNDHLILTNML